jgi:hypothetical protein
MTQTAPAQETERADARRSVCLRSNQIDNWEVKDGRTMIVTDRRDNKYELGLAGACAGLDNSEWRLGFESLSELSCIRPGDSIHYVDPVFGRERCTITRVEPYVEPETDESEG